MLSGMNQPECSFTLYNEPHDVSWDIWLKEGQDHGPAQLTEEMVAKRAKAAEAK